MVRPKPAPIATAVRCAIYTRKSSEDGLEQEFNSLDAQREAAEAFIASQKHEGWTAIPDRYDDGGYSGGNVERPGLQQLLADIDAGKVDCVVVYKVERLEEVEDRLDTIDERLEEIDAILTDLIACCEYNTACCEENRYCCEYLDQRVDYCCGPGKPGPGDPGGGPECGRCVWEWDGINPPVQVLGCSGGPDCHCEPPTVFDGSLVYFSDCYSTLSGDCEHDGCPDLVIVDLPGIANLTCGGCPALDGIAVPSVGECLYEGVFDRGPCVDQTNNVFVRVQLTLTAGTVTSAQVEFFEGNDASGTSLASYSGSTCLEGAVECTYAGPGSDPTGTCSFPSACVVRF